MLRRLRSFWGAATGRAAFERDMHDELRFHVESRTADLIRRGLPADAAARQARLEFGNTAVYRDRCRDARRLTLLDDLQADLRFSLRAMRKDAP
ncbi:MAG TPA: permease prefix domain 1-containing protein, partial [Vicinamibacterales bacterium]|nr:permease prefix domain 1-containing protein [Vicinamibacterales bacterium]